MKKASSQKVFTYTIFKSQFEYSSFAMSDIQSLNLTIGSCQKLFTRNFKNICVEFDCEPFTIRQHKIIPKLQIDYNFYVVCYTWNGLTIPNYCNRIEDILHLVNEYLKDTINVIQRIVIVNCTHSG